MYFKSIFTSIILVAICTLLAYNYMHGGVPSHHILNDKTLPEISNWWGAILLPLLTWVVLFRIQQRLKVFNLSYETLTKTIIIGFIASFLIGLGIAISFTFGLEETPGYLLLSILVSSIFYPIYRSECLLGFVLGMTFTFGAVLPTGIGLILSCLGFVIYHSFFFLKKLFLNA